MIDPGRFKVISFDCYGTLIDWEAGILSSLKVILAAHGAFPEGPELLEQYAAFEKAAEEGEYTEYRKVLQSVVREFGIRHGFLPTPAELETLVSSLPGWKPFEDTVEALTRIGKRYRLAILSNVDEDLFQQTAGTLGANFDPVVTAQQLRSYKPSKRNFEALIGRARVGREQILHAAQSLYHDIRPAAECGLATVWIRRPSIREGFGATPAADAQPDMEVQSLAELAMWAGT